ncbi:MAG: helix-turn-helix domain-containing protein, partial [Bacteroides sp.]|nr:helix-turn-helix domain-containing protein [Bacteroides sp.]
MFNLKLREAIMFTDSEKLKKFRDEFKITQAALADKLGVTKSLIAAIEGGNRNLSLNLIRKIKEVYNFDLYNLVKVTTEESSVQKIQNSCVPIRFYKVGAAAGNGNYLTDIIPEEDMLYFDERWLKNILGVNPANLHLVFADGDSMDS